MRLFLLVCVHYPSLHSHSTTLALFPASSIILPCFISPPIYEGWNMCVPWDDYCLKLKGYSHQREGERRAGLEHSVSDCFSKTFTCTEEMSQTYFCLRPVWHCLKDDRISKLCSHYLPYCGFDISHPSLPTPTISLAHDQASPACVSALTNTILTPLNA